MDYATTTFVKPYAGVVPYRLPGINYTNATPAFLQKRGFRTYLFHGNTGLFYDRVDVMKNLGFDEIFFKEQLENRNMEKSTIGFRDADVFRLAAEILGRRQKSFVFVITLDTHFPFTQISPSEMRVYPRPENEAQRYLNSLRHLDNCLRSLIRGAPDGVTFVLYGDHTASLDAAEFHSDVVAGREFVPCLIFQKGRDLASNQSGRSLEITTNGSFNILDVISYLRSSAGQAKER
jgi:phosphoglycerol transferase MdoB-like AlkP superfamily enzyme